MKNKIQGGISEGGISEGMCFVVLRSGCACKYHREKQAGMDGSKRGTQRRQKGPMQCGP